MHPPAVAKGISGVPRYSSGSVVRRAFGLLTDPRAKQEMQVRAVPALRFPTRGAHADLAFTFAPPHVRADSVSAAPGDEVTGIEGTRLDRDGPANRNSTLR